ncbi:excisionase family DNA binding protein [Friedmanniella endophytica]|uniref:Excisionase family DNA binding protein n=1 Tax=Microlunatus kandeliicorticis TaxID=1759536 RepID=A0A7W3P737_9ACTN|nr:helix-turn-helix domain-containing protein [Microlunatus kandeliicorticis]MBA8795570.1 excisionase family DNA binding protein [Microlunatus kandeliicorticis]
MGKTTARQIEFPSLSVAQSADLSNVSQKTIRRLIAAGTLPAYRVGARALRIKESDLMSIMNRIPAGGLE